LLLFVIVFCARPQDWGIGLSALPLAKITGSLALIAFAFSASQIHLRLPREAILLLLLLAQLFATVPMSPVWPGGAFWNAVDFAKVALVFLGIVIAVTTLSRLRGVMFVQSASVVAVAVAALWKGRLATGRLEGLLDGIYANPNDLALAGVLSIPLCLALVFSSRNRFRKVVGIAAVLLLTHVVLRTGSRGGFLSLVVVTAICLWEFGIRGRRAYLIFLFALAGPAFWQSSTATLAGRLHNTFSEQPHAGSAYGSVLQRERLFRRSLEVTEEHPLFGVGPGNFLVISGNWQVTHNSFTQMSAEAGLPALALYLWFLGRGFNNLRALKRLSEGRGNFGALAGGLRASFAGYTVGSFFASAAYQFFPYLLVAYTTVLLRIARQSPVSFQSLPASGSVAAQPNLGTPSQVTAVS
jgi:hypothetical protein